MQLTAEYIQQLRKLNPKLTKKQFNALIIFESYLQRNNYTVQKELTYNKLFEGCTRQFRCDYFIQKNDFKAIIEINGGQFTGGRHTRGGSGYENDLTKSNLANYYNIKYFQFTYEMLYRYDYQNFF